MKFLIVEDHAPMRRMLKSLIADLATSIHECTDGNTALACYTEQQPDCVLMDIGLPGLNGLAATKQITKAFPAARIVIVTNYSDAGVREAALAAGACGFVLKENLLELPQQLRLELAHKTIPATNLPPTEKGTTQ